MNEQEFTELKKMLGDRFVTKDDLQQAMTNKEVPEDRQKLALEFIDHMQQCKGDDCAIHKAKDQIESKSFSLGFMVRDLLDEE